MNLAVLSQIEARIDQLSLAEQLWLLERIAQRVRALASLIAQQHGQQPLIQAEDIRRFRLPLFRKSR